MEESQDLTAIGAWGQCVPVPFIGSPSPPPAPYWGATLSLNFSFLSPGALSKLFLTQVHATLGGMGGAAQAPAYTSISQMSIWGKLSRE